MCYSWIIKELIEILSIIAVLVVFEGFLHSILQTSSHIIRIFKKFKPMISWVTTVTLQWVLISRNARTLTDIIRFHCNFTITDIICSNTDTTLLNFNAYQIYRLYDTASYKDTLKPELKTKYQIFRSTNRQAVFKKGEGDPYLQNLKSNMGTMFHIRAQVMLKNWNIKSQIEL